MIAGLAIAGSGCSSKSENPDARNLLAMAENDFNSGNYASSIALLDSLQQTFPAETALQREAMAMRPKVIEAEATKALAAVDSTYNADIETLKSLKTQLKWIKTPRMIEGYWIAPEVYRSDFMNTTGIEARVSEIGEFYIVSSVNPAGNLKHQSIGLKTSAGNARTQNVAYDGESNYRIGGGGSHYIFACSVGHNRYGSQKCRGSKPSSRCIRYILWRQRGEVGKNQSGCP